MLRDCAMCFPVLVSHATLQAQHLHVGSERKHKSFSLHGKHFIDIALSPLRDYCSTKVLKGLCDILFQEKGKKILSHFIIYF